MWAAAIALSTLLTHQHHILDVLTGWALASVCIKVIYKHFMRPESHVSRRSFPES